MVSTTVPSFEDFIAANERSVKAFAAKFDLPRDEVVNTAYVAWSEAREVYSPNHPSRAKFNTFAVDKLHGMLFAGTTDPCAFAQSADTKYEEYALGDQKFFEPRDRGLESGREPGGAVDELVEDFLTRAYSDLAFDDAIRGHAVYAHPHYRVVIDGVLANIPRPELAARLSLTPRRVYQMLYEIETIIRRNDPILDDRLIAIPPDGVLDADPVRLRNLGSLSFKPLKELDRDLLVATLRVQIKHGQLVPVVIDQFYRVLVGDYECGAAHTLGIAAIKTILRPIGQGKESRDDERFAALKRELDLTDARPTYQLELIDSLKKRVQKGSLGPLVGARLAHLPLRQQEHVTGQLGWYVTALEIDEANELVAAHHAGRLDRVLERIANAMHAKADRERAKRAQ